MRISDWSSDVCSSDLGIGRGLRILRAAGRQGADGQCKREGEGNLLQLHGNLLGSVGSELVRQSNVYVAVDAFPGAGRMLELAALAHPGLHRCLGQELRSEEHTSELQPLMRISYAVFCLKNKKSHITTD